MPPPMAVRLVRSPHMAKLQAASVPIAYGSCAPRAATTDRRKDGRIAVSLNALLRRGHNKRSSDTLTEYVYSSETIYTGICELEFANSSSCDVNWNIGV